VDPDPAGPRRHLDALRPVIQRLLTPTSAIPCTFARSITAPVA
jgi:hypothetical protein